MTLRAPSSLAAASRSSKEPKSAREVADAASESAAVSSLEHAARETAAVAITAMPAASRRERGKCDMGFLL
jgi:hypothetical protein